MTSEPVGLREIAERLGVRKQTAHMWHYRGVLPKPKWIVSGAPAWEWRDIQRWAEDKGYPRRSSSPGPRV